jgi:hypothetical protein
VLSQIVAEVGACCARVTAIVVTTQPAGGALDVKAADGHCAAAAATRSAAHRPRPAREKDSDVSEAEGMVGSKRRGGKGKAKILTGFEKCG